MRWDRLGVAALTALVVLLVLVAACGDDDYGPYTVVGAACRTELDCAPGADCQTGGDFPNGSCTLPCRGHFDCPPNTACIEKHGGVCLPRCGNDLGCRVEYKCKAQNDRDGDGQSFVCIK